MTLLLKMGRFGLLKSLPPQQLLRALVHSSARTGAAQVAAVEDKTKYVDAGQSASVKQVEVVAKEYAEEVVQMTERWNQMHETYYGKDRDMKNFPLMKMEEYHPKVRMGFIPDSWFQAFYNKTGVTGPYLFMWGGIMFLIQKEYWVIDHEFIEVIPFGLAIYFLLRKFGHKLGNFLDKRAERYDYLLYKRPLERLRMKADSTIDQVGKEVEKADGVKHLFQAKRENVDLQLEAAYRQRLMDVHKTVKARLDYQLQLEYTRRRFQQHHMVDWIVDNVIKGITPQQEKEALTKCMVDLKGLAQKAKAAPAVA